MSHAAPPASSRRRESHFNRIAPNKSLASTLLENRIGTSPCRCPWVLQANALDRSARIAGRGDWSKIKPLFLDRMAEGARSL